MILPFTDQVDYSAHGSCAIQAGGGAFYDADFGDIIDENFGVRISDIISPLERVNNLQ